MFVIYTRFQLAGYKKGVPKKLIAIYIANAAINLITTILYMSIIKTGYNATSLGTGIAVVVIMVFANKAYYDKRAFLFVN